MTDRRFYALLVPAFAFALVSFSSGCGTGEGEATGEIAETESRPATATEADPAPAVDYESLAEQYEEMAGEMTADRGEVRRMHQMAGQMRHFAGMMGEGRPMAGEMPMGMGRHMRGMRHGAMGAGGPVGMAEWHLQMAELHSQWADAERAAGNAALAEHLEQMAGRHRDVSERFGVQGIEPDVGESPETAEGAALYAANCSGCHGSGGQGVTGAFPPLAGSRWVVGPADRTARIVLRGLYGPLEVAGETYYGVMPSFARSLDDEQIAALLTFVRSSWGNQVDGVTPQEVARIRAETAGRRGFTADELEPSGS